MFGYFFGADALMYRNSYFFAMKMSKQKIENLKNRILQKDWRNFQYCPIVSKNTTFIEPLKYSIFIPLEVSTSFVSNQVELYNKKQKKVDYRICPAAFWHNTQMTGHSAVGLSIIFKQNFIRKLLLLYTFCFLVTAPTLSLDLLKIQECNLSDLKCHVR